MNRVGFGFDLHPLVSGRPLVLGGVTVPSELGLDGHSDADVLAHAVGEGLLGALALGDLGRHFPDTDPRWRGVSSLLLGRPHRLARSAQLAAGAFRPGLRAQPLERLKRRLQPLARLRSLLRAPKPLAEDELGPAALERRRYEVVQLECDIEERLERVVGRQEPTAPCRGRQCGDAARGLRLQLERVENLRGAVRAPSMTARLDQVRRPLENPGQIGRASCRERVL